MAELLHITERSSWEAARAAGTYEMSTRGRTLDEVGFIHCSLRHQLPGVAKMLYDDCDPSELVVLVIDSELVTAPVRYEPPEPGAVCADGADGQDGQDGQDAAGGKVEEFPHIYGPLPLSAVVAEEPWNGNSATA